ncbi:target of Myb protein 1-like protein [Striga asiatica]|uniref:Target of Myb protein 1-like protein n=1 Tax=Striga asiatica TaxID=4170 RepID=A0A5A7PAV2_STRAF|nr:target of Myb protein 1-like protein [Striga asiatica]
MDKLDLSKLKTASSAIGERIRSGGAHVGRTISSKVKEILQHSQTPESRLVNEATAAAIPEWPLNLRICAMVGRGELDGAGVVREVGRRLSRAGDPAAQGLALDLLDALASNCEAVLPLVASEKVLEEMAELIEDPRTEQGVRVRAMQLIRAWGVSEELEHLPDLRFKEIQQGAREEDSFPPTFYNLESYLGQRHPSPPETRPVASTLVEDDAALFGYDFESVEEKKEILAQARNTLDILSTILNTDAERNPVEDELTISMLEKCKQYSLPNVQRIIESTSDDEVMLFDALNLHDELQLLISRHGSRHKAEADETSRRRRRSEPKRIEHRRMRRAAEPKRAKMNRAEARDSMVFSRWECYVCSRVFVEKFNKPHEKEIRFLLHCTTLNLISANATRHLAPGTRLVASTRVKDDEGDAAHFGYDFESDELTKSVLEKYKKYSLPNVQRIIESTSDDEVMLFDALNLHDELQLLISRHGDLISSN